MMRFDADFRASPPLRLFYAATTPLPLF